MVKTIIAVVFAFEVVIATTAFAKSVHTTAVLTSEVTPSAIACWSGFVCKDLFDRDNPNNVWFDWPGPPAQPGQF